MAHEHISEQKLARLWHEITRAHFLHHLNTAETVATLERRREIVMQLLDQEATQEHLHDEAARLMVQHFSALLKAELSWLERSLRVLHMTTCRPDQQ